MTHDTPLTNAAEPDLANAAEDNLFALFRAMTQALGGELEENGRLSRYYTHPLSPLFKGVFQARLAPDETDAAIAETTAWFKARNAPFFFWWTGEGTQPADLGERLPARGFAAFEQNAPLMAADMERVNGDGPRPPELRIAPVASDQELVQWKETFNRSFDVPDFAGQAWVDATRAVGIGRTPWRLLVGALYGEPVCCGLLFCGAGVAGIIGLGVLPAHRRQGIGSAMHLECLRIGRETGYRYAALFSSEMGYSSYLKLGYRDTGRRISRYLWRNS